MNIRSRRSNMSHVNKKYKKKIRVINKARLILFIALLLIILYPAIMFAVGKPSDQVQKTYVKVYIEPGDTLWSIAQSYLPSKTDIRDFIHSIKKVNKLDSSLIRVGDFLFVPVATHP